MATTASQVEGTSGARLASRALNLPPTSFFVVSAIFHYLGPALAVLLFAHVAALGVMWLRVAGAAVVFAVWRRPWRLAGRLDRRQRTTLPYGAGGVPCFLNTASIAAWAHFSPSALDTPIEPITSPSSTIGNAPGCGKSCIKVGAKF